MHCDLDTCWYFVDKAVPSFQIRQKIFPANFCYQNYMDKELSKKLIEFSLLQSEPNLALFIVSGYSGNRKESIGGKRQSR